MQLGLVGLGRMGGNMRERAPRVPATRWSGYDPQPDGLAMSSSLAAGRRR